MAGALDQAVCHSGNEAAGMGAVRVKATELSGLGLLTAVRHGWATFG
jgi:hypothetical protein